jgi:hypothetical protein
MAMTYGRSETPPRAEALTSWVNRTFGWWSIRTSSRWVSLTVTNKWRNLWKQKDKKTDRYWYCAKTGTVLRDSLYSPLIFNLLWQFSGCLASTLPIPVPCIRCKLAAYTETQWLLFDLLRSKRFHLHMLTACCGRVVPRSCISLVKNWDCEQSLGCGTCSTGMFLLYPTFPSSSLDLDISLIWTKMFSTFQAIVSLAVS